MISKLAQAFGKSEDEVRDVFDEVKADHQAEMQSEFEARLDEAVSDGEITEEQKQLILEKHEELMAEKQDQWENFKDLSPEERREAIQSHHEELETWAEENSIDLKYFFGGYKMHKGMHGVGKSMRGFGGMGGFAK